MSGPREAYTAGRDARAADARGAEARSRTIGTVRVVLALAAVGFLAAQAWGPLGASGGWAAAASVAAFAAMVVVHGRVSAAEERAIAARRFHERGLLRLDDRWSELPSAGARFAAADHPYADDLDVFGPSSLFQRIDRTETRMGEERLASWLAAACEPVDLADVRARQVAVKDLAARLEFRERLSAAGALSVTAEAGKPGEERPDPEPFLKWAEGALPFEGASRWTWIALVLPVLFLAGAIANSAGAPRLAWIVPLVAELAVLGATGRYVTPIADAVLTREGALARFAGMLQVMATEPFQAPELQALQAKLRSSGAEATVEMARLERIMGFLDARNSGVWRILIAPLLLWELNWVLALERWRARAGRHVRAWIDAVAEMEALASLAGLAFECPDYAFPEIGDSPRYESEQLGHPLIAPAKRVCNDASLGHPGSALVITGSNMSGKSTLLRAIGVNAVLALAGGPVCARRLAIGPIRVAASIRVRDSLAEGVSRFYAEVRKLKAVIERARAGRIPATLFLLDEVLHGTNSRERLIGARAIVRELVARGAMGGVSTHDLALGDLEHELPGSVSNVHFEEQVEGDTMTFDYKLRPGVVHSSNALRIMRMVGIDVVNAE